jgi:hypothetical protein
MKTKSAQNFLAAAFIVALEFQTGAQEVLPRPEQPFGGHI